MKTELRPATPAGFEAVGDLVYRLLCELAPEKCAGFERQDYIDRAASLLAVPNRVWAYLAFADGRSPIRVIMLNECASINAPWY